MKEIVVNLLRQLKWLLICILKIGIQGSPRGLEKIERYIILDGSREQSIATQNSLSWEE